MAAKYSCNWRAASLLASLLFAAVTGASGDEPAPAEIRRKLGARALSLLRESTRNAEAEVRSAAIESFGAIGNKGAVPILQQALKDKDRSVQIAAAENLARLGDPAGVPALERFASERPAKSKTPGAKAVEELRALARGKTRAAAIRALARLGAVESAKVYRRGKNDPVGAVRDAAAAGLARLGELAELDPFIAALDKDDDQDLRAAAVRALGDSGVAEAIEPLTKASKDSSADVRVAAVQALGLVGGNAAVAPLKAALEDESELVRAKAIEALGRLRYTGVVPALLAAREREQNAYLKLLALESLARHAQEVELNLAQRSLSQSDVDTRLVGVRVLEAASGDVALELLGKALDDGDARVRVQASAALVRRLGRRPEPAAVSRGAEDDRVPEAGE